MIRSYMTMRAHLATTGIWLRRANRSRRARSAPSTATRTIAEGLRTPAFGERAIVIVRRTARAAHAACPTTAESLASRPTGTFARPHTATMGYWTPASVKARLIVAGLAALAARTVLAARAPSIFVRHAFAP